jgi:putative transposase
MPSPNPFRYFKTSPEIIRLAVMLFIRFPLALRNVEDTSAVSKSAINHTVLVEPVRPMFAAGPCQSIRFDQALDACQ